MEKNKKINIKKLICLIVIIALSLLCISEGILSYYYYNQNQENIEYYSEVARRAQENLIEAKEEYNKENPFLSFNEVKKYFESYYINDVDIEKISDSLAKAYVESSGDKYANYFTKEEWEEYDSQFAGNSYGIGTAVNYKEKGILVVRVYKDSPADKAGIKPGDYIIGTDQINFIDIGYSNAIDYIKGEKGTFVNLKINRDGQELLINVERNDYNLQTVFYENLDNKLALITISDFYEITLKEFSDAITKAKENQVKGVIFDLRNNTGGLLSVVANMLDMLIDEGPIVHIVSKNEEDSYTIDATSGVELDVPMVVLVNELTASAGELFTSALKDHKLATVVGTVTYGKGCGQNILELKNGDYLKLTTFLYNPPFSTNYDGIGITPDILIEESEELLSSAIGVIEKEKDNQLQKAIEEILKSIK